MTIAASNSVEVKIPQDHPENTKLGTDGYRKLVGMMQDTFGKYVDFCPIHRSLLARTDDTTLFISPGKIITHCKDNEMLVSSVHDKNSNVLQEIMWWWWWLKCKKEVVSKLTLPLLVKDKCLIRMAHYQVWQKDSYHQMNVPL